MKIRAFASLTCLTFLSCAPTATADYLANLCERRLTPVRTLLLQDLSRMEQEFVRIRWHHYKYREMVYDPLWQASIMKEDRFSPEVRARGEVLYERYRHESSSLMEMAREDTQLFQDHLTEFLGALSQGVSTCQTSSFQECFGNWQAGFESELIEFQKVVRRYFDQERMLNEAVVRTLTESPSDHEDFAGRFPRAQDLWDQQFYIPWLMLMRRIREEIEFDWPSEKCCSSCGDKGLLPGDDPVLNKVRADPQANKGVSGELMNKAGLLPAFEEQEQTQGHESGDQERSSFHSLENSSEPTASPT